MPDLGRITEPLMALLEALIGSRLDYHALYPCTVAAQSGNTVDLVPDDERVRGFGLGSVAIKTGAPGYRYELPAGARVLLGFEAGDPARPYCAIWESTTSVTRITFDGGTADVARTGDSVHAGFVVYATMGGIVQDIPGPPASDAIQYFPAGVVGAAQAAAAVVTIVTGGDIGKLRALSDGLITSGNSKLRA